MTNLLLLLVLSNVILVTLGLLLLKLVTKSNDEIDKSQLHILANEPLLRMLMLTTTKLHLKILIITIMILIPLNHALSNVMNILNEIKLLVYSRRKRQNVHEIQIIHAESLMNLLKHGIYLTEDEHHFLEKKKKLTTKQKTTISNVPLHV